MRYTTNFEEFLLKKTQQMSQTELFETAPFYRYNMSILFCVFFFYFVKKNKHTNTNKKTSNQRNNQTLSNKLSRIQNETSKGKFIYAYSNEFLDACLLPEKELQTTVDFNEWQKTKAKFIIPQGWYKNKPRSPRSYVSHSKKPHPARCEGIVLLFFY